MSAESTLPHRGTGMSDDAVPDTDPSDTSKILLERLQAYKHAVGYLEDYISTTEKMQKTHAKEYEKILKVRSVPLALKLLLHPKGHADHFQTVSHPLKEGQHFDQSLGGIAGLFEIIRANTQGIANAHLETEKNIKGSVLPLLERLHHEIKNKSKELSGGAVKGSKTVDKARNETQKYIELLGQYTGTAASSGGKVDAHHDPYVLQRGVNHRLGKQLLEENNNREDLIAVQNSFQQFEAHVIQTIQQALASFVQYMGGQYERQRGMYAEMASTAQRIPPDFEFKSFIKRNSEYLMDPTQPKRTASDISFPNQNHPSAQPLISGTLERKSRALGGLKGYSAGFYAVTPSKYLHEFKDDDDFRRDPTPELSLYLPDCMIGGISGDKFNVKGKDASKGKVGAALAMSHELTFKAHSPADAERWWRAICEAAGAGNVTNEPPSPSSPVESRNTSGQHFPPEKTVEPVQTQGLPAGQGPQSASTTPGSALSAGTMKSPGASGVGGAPGQY